MKKRITQLLLASILLLLPTLAVYAGNDEGHLLTLTYDKAMCEVSVEGFQRVYQSGDRISDGAYVLLLVKPLDGYVMDEATYNGTPIHFERYSFDKEGKTLSAYFTVREDVNITVTTHAIQYAMLSLKYDASKGLADVYLQDKHFKDGDKIPKDVEIVLDLIPNESSEVESVLINERTYHPEDFKQSVMSPGSMYRLVLVDGDMNIVVNFKAKGASATLLEWNANDPKAPIQLYNAVGVKLYEGCADGVSLEALPQGIYFIVQHGAVHKLMR